MNNSAVLIFRTEMKPTRLAIYLAFTLLSLLWATLTIFEQSRAIQTYTVFQAMFYLFALVCWHLEKLVPFHAVLGLLFQLAFSLYGIRAFEHVTKSTMQDLILLRFPENTTIASIICLINCFLVLVIGVVGVVPMGRKIIKKANEPKPEIKALKVGHHFTNVKVNDLEDVCSICLSEFDSSCVQSNKCSHTFHLGCIQDWLVLGKDTCPNCKTLLTDIV